MTSSTIYTASCLGLSRFTDEFNIVACSSSRPAPLIKHVTLYQECSALFWLWPPFNSAIVWQQFSFYHLGSDLSFILCTCVILIFSCAFRLRPKFSTWGNFFQTNDLRLIEENKKSFPSETSRKNYTFSDSGITYKPSYFSQTYLNLQSPKSVTLVFLEMHYVLLNGASK